MEDEFRVTEYITGFSVYTAKTLVTEMMREAIIGFVQVLGRTSS